MQRPRVPSNLAQLTHIQIKFYWVIPQETCISQGFAQPVAPHRTLTCVLQAALRNVAMSIWTTASFDHDPFFQALK